MGQRDSNATEERLLSRRGSTIRSRVSTDNGSATESEEQDACSTLVIAAAACPAHGPKLDKRSLIDPRLLFVGSKIGEGAHGKVYEGRYGDMTVAIKVLQPAKTDAEQAMRERRFAREVDMMSRVQHRNLVKFIGACKEPLMAIATELLPGVSLRKHMMNLRPQRLELGVAVSYALDIAQAMNWLHMNGIIHRDLKPDNLLLTADMKSLKLIDFGLAREETLTEMMTAETGTYRWMAPELYSTVTLRHGDKKHYNNKVDVYSFGIVLWELLTNRMPFEGMSNLQAAYAVAFKNVRPSLPDGLPEELVFILKSCWAEDPNVRPTFGQIVRILTSFILTQQDTEMMVSQPTYLGKSSTMLKESPNARLMKEDMPDSAAAAFL
eukprot:c27638_g3_i3 orf=573-1712(+)